MFLVGIVVSFSSRHFAAKIYQKSLKLYWKQLMLTLSTKLQVALCKLCFCLFAQFGFMGHEQHQCFVTLIWKEFITYSIFGTLPEKR